MAYQIEVTRKGLTKILKDAITRKPLTYPTAEEAQRCADSHFALWRCDWKNQGQRPPAYRILNTDKQP